MPAGAPDEATAENAAVFFVQLSVIFTAHFLPFEANRRWAWFLFDYLFQIGCYCGFALVGGDGAITSVRSFVRFG